MVLCTIVNKHSCLKLLLDDDYANIYSQLLQDYVSFPLVLPSPGDKLRHPSH